jgi:type III pantothenate kinase
MALRAMHEHTAALPSISYREPDAGSFGKNTEQAMLQGVHVGLQGLVWKLVEQYAMQYGAFPVVLATGGDAATLFCKDELVNAIVPDLTLHGIHESWRAAFEAESEPSRPAVQRATATAEVRPGGCGDGCGCHTKHDDQA